MATLRQINASRKNGARSKGPVTPEGKARVSQNGIKHGIYSKRVVLHNEDPAAYQALREALLNDWGPTSAFERNLIFDIAEARWRLSRFTTLETAALDFEVERMRPEVANTFQHIDEATRTVLAFNALLTHNNTHQVLQAASLHQHRIIDRATTQLLRLHKIRPGNNPGGDNPGAGTAASATHTRALGTPVSVPEPAAALEPAAAAAAQNDTARAETEAQAPGPATTSTSTTTSSATKNTAAIQRTKPEPAAIAAPASAGYGTSGALKPSLNLPEITQAEEPTRKTRPVTTPNRRAAAA